MIDLLLPALVVLPFVIGVCLLVAKRRGLSDATGEAFGVGTAAVLLLLSFVALWMMSGDLPVSQESAMIVPRIEFSPAWLTLRLPAVVASNHSGWSLSLGLDGIGFSMVLLTAIVTLAVLLLSHDTITSDRCDFAGWVLLAMSGLMLVFTSMDLVLFYVGFELALIPLFALIVKWGDKDAPVVAKRFVLYTLAGSIPMVIGLLGIAKLYSDDDGWVVGLPELSRRAASSVSMAEMLGFQSWIFGFLVLGLGIKMALLPFHTWLPKTYGACHATAGAFLAAVVLKLGLFGFVRLALPMVPQACERFGPTTMGLLGAVAIVAGALMALAQTDLRRLLAYSSLSHVGFITLGLFALNEEGISGAVLQMFNHGITTAAVFLAASCIIARRGSSSIDSSSAGIAQRYPVLAVVTVFFLAAGAGVPGLNNFVGETLTLTAMVSRHPLIAAFGALGIVLGAWYSFRLIQTVLFGEPTTDRLHESLMSTLRFDLCIREKLVFGVLASVCLLIGIYPQLAIDVYEQDVKQLNQSVQVSQPSDILKPAVEPKP